MRRRFKNNGSGFNAAYRCTKKGKREDNSLYRKFRQTVRKRDKKCQFPGCDHSCGLKQVHHILLYAHNPLLRYEERNGILLCKKCHDSIHGREAYYIELFSSIVLKKYE